MMNVAGRWAVEVHRSAEWGRRGPGRFFGSEATGARRQFHVRRLTSHVLPMCNGMNIFYVIGVIVVVVFILKFLGVW
jgi:hypothetical protein